MLTSVSPPPPSSAWAGESREGLDDGRLPSNGADGLKCSRHIKIFVNMSGIHIVSVWWFLCLSSYSCD